MKKSVLNTVRALLGVSIIAFLLSKIGIQSTFSVLEKVSFPALVLYLFLFAASFCVDTLIYKLFLNPLSIKINFRELFKYNLISWSAGIFTPAKIGCFSIVYFLKKENMSIGKAMALIVLVKGVSLAVITLSAAFGILFFSLNLKIASPNVVAAIALFAVLILLLSKKYILARFADQLNSFFEVFKFFLKKKTKILFLNFGLTFIKFLIGALRIYILFTALQNHVPFFPIYLVNSLSLLATMIPLTISGLGVKESVAMFFYVKMGVSMPVIMSVCLIAVIINYLLAGITVLLTLIKLK